MTQEDKNLVLERYYYGREEFIIRRYLVEGPDVLVSSLGLNADEWAVIFEKLVFEHNILYKCVINSLDFFVDLFIRYGNDHLRKILNVRSSSYDGAWYEQVFDLVAVSNEGLKFHVLENKSKYTGLLVSGRGDELRAKFGILGLRYNGLWEEVLDILLNSACEEIFSGRSFDHAISAFCRSYSSSRAHRKI